MLLSAFTMGPDPLALARITCICMFFFFFFFWVLVYCAKAVRAYVTHYYTMRRGAKRGSSILIRVGSDVYPSSRLCLVGLSTNPSSTSTASAIPYLFSSSVVGLYVLRIGRSIH